MKKLPFRISRAILIALVICFNTKFSYSQVVYQNHYQTTYDLGCTEINYTLIQKYDSSYFLVPASNCDSSSTSAYFLRLLEIDQSFNPAWAANVILSSPYDDTLSSMIAYDLIQSRDSSLYACGIATFRYYPYQKQGFILKLGASGGSNWLKFYPPIEELSSIIQTPDNSFAACGKLYQSTDTSRLGVILKVTSTGTVSWANTYWESQGSWRPVTGFNHLIASNDTIYAIGTTNQGTSNGPQADVILAKLKQNGNTINQMAYTRASDPPITTTQEFGKTLKFRNGLLWLAGDIKSSDTLSNNQDYFVMQVSNSNLLPVWTQRYDISSTVANRSGESVQRFLPGGDSLKLVGFVNNLFFNPTLNDNAFLVKMSNLGNSPVYNIFGDDSTDRFYKPIVNYDNNIVAAGYSNSFNADQDIYLVEKYGSVIQQCHDTSLVKAPIKLKFDTNLVHYGNYHLSAVDAKFSLFEIDVKQDSICPKVIVHKNEKRTPPPAGSMGMNTVVVGPAGQIVLPANTREYQIFSMAGTIVKKGAATGYGLLDVSTLKPGVYILHLINDKGERVNTRFIK